VGQEHGPTRHGQNMGRDTEMTMDMSLAMSTNRDRDMNMSMDRDICRHQHRHRYRHVQKIFDQNVQFKNLTSTYTHNYYVRYRRKLYK
jgi:hypothetical protein